MKNKNIKSILENLRATEDALPILLELDAEILAKFDPDDLDDLLGLTNELRELVIQSVDAISTLKKI